MALQAVLFDLDGVLVDACDWHYEALNKSLLKFGYPAIAWKDHVSTFNGLPTKAKLDILGISDEEALKINKQKQEYTIETIRNNAVLMEEKIELHQYLRSQGTMIACVTNSKVESATEMLIATGQMSHIDLLVTNEQVARNKPYPDCYNHAIGILQVDPSDCLCVEDSHKGIEAAKSCLARHLWIVNNSSEVNKSSYIRLVESIL